MFDITANGVPLLKDFDPLSDAGGSNTADVRVFSGTSPAADGKLHLKFRNHWQLKGVAFVLAWALSTASGETSTPSTSKPRSAIQIAFVPVPAPISSAGPGMTAPEQTNSMSRGSGSPVSQGSCREA